MNIIITDLLTCHHPREAEDGVDGEVIPTLLIIMPMKTITITMDMITITTGVAMMTHTTAMRTSKDLGEDEESEEVYAAAPVRIEAVCQSHQGAEQASPSEEALRQWEVNEVTETLHTKMWLTTFYKP